MDYTPDVLSESRSARDSYLANVSHDRADIILNKIKSLTLIEWNGKAIATTKQVADFYEVSEETVGKSYRRNRDEFASDGTFTLKGVALRDFKELPDTMSGSSNTPHAIAWTPRSIFRLGMLLRDSPIAKAVRDLILNFMEGSQNDRLIRKLEAELELSRLENENLRLKLELITKIKKSGKELRAQIAACCGEIELPEDYIEYIARRVVERYSGQTIDWMKVRTMGRTNGNKQMLQKHQVKVILDRIQRDDRGFWNSKNDFTIK